MAAEGNFEKGRSEGGSKGRGPHHDGDPADGSGVSHPSGVSRLPGKTSRRPAKKAKKVQKPAARRTSKKRKSAKRG